MVLVVVGNLAILISSNAGVTVYPSLLLLDQGLLYVHISLHQIAHAPDQVHSPNKYLFSKKKKNTM